MLQVSFPLGSRSLTVYGLTQYDYGQELEVHGLPLPAVVECQISLQRVGGTTESLAGVAVDDTLTLAIPDTYLAADTDSDYTIYVYIYVTTEASGTTVYLVSLPVTARSMPEGYVPGETSPFAAVIDEMRELVEDAQDAATLSESYAKGGTGTRTGEDTDNSKYYSEEARDAEAGAADSAAEARASEVAAAGSASTAAAASTSAAEAKTAAEAARDAATAKATEAANSASAAGVSAAAASASETAAGAYASTAGASAVSAASSASAAGSSATSAASSASSAESSATAAAAAKQDALTAISGAQTTAVGAVAAEGTAQKAAVQAKGTEVIASIPEDYTELSNDVSSLKSDKADKDGTYSTLTAGNLATEDGANNSTPYLFRASGGGVRVGEREYDKIVGGTVAWNQIINQVETITITFTEQALYYGLLGAVATSFNTFKDHIYLFGATVNRSIAQNNAVGIHALVVNSPVCVTFANGEADGLKYNVCKETSDRNGTNLNYNNYTGKRQMDAGDSISVNDVMLFDLTQMFGTTIADYIYTIETATAGAGIAKLKEWGFFAEDYYPYNAGELKSVEGLTSHEMVGFNQCEEEWELGIYSVTDGSAVASNYSIRCKNRIRVLPSTEYYYNNIYLRLLFYDANDAFISYVVGSGIKTTPSNAAYIRYYLADAYGTTYNHDICINFSDPAKNGTYEPYAKHTYPLDDSLTLRGIPKLDSANQLYYDGDTYESDGTVTRNVVQVEVTSAVSVGTASTGAKYGTVNLTNASKYAEASANNYLSNNYQYRVNPPSDGGKWFRIIQSILYIFDERFTDLATANSILGTEKPQFVYVGLTTTSETAEPFAAPQIVDQYGTEEYVTTGIVPVGHETFYPENLRQKIEGLPWNFASLIAPTEVTYKATQNYTSGALFIVNNMLYKATANIANGGTITPGTNCTPTTLAAVIAAL